jgi:hypothetical protein
VHNESRILNASAAVLLLAANAYAWWTGRDHHVEWSGTVALVLSGLLCAMCGLYLAYLARHVST